MNDNSKESLTKAIAEFEAIKKFALEEATKNMEKNIEDKLLNIINNSVVEENVKVEIETDNEVITADENGFSIEQKNENPLEGGLDGIGASEETGGEEGEAANLGMPLSDGSEEEMEGDEEFEITSDEDSFEIENDTESEEEINEQDNIEQQTMQNNTQVNPEQEATDQIINGIKQLVQLGSNDGTESQEDGQVDIVDDETAGAAPQPAPQGAAPQAAPDMNQEAPIQEEDEIYEFVDEVNEEESDDMMTIDLDDDGEMDEMKMHGVSNSVQRTAGESAGPQNAIDNRSRQYRVNESKIIAQNEAVVAELKKENLGLRKKVNEQKGEIEKFFNSFVELRDQLNLLESFNSKLFLMTKTLISNDYNEQEKIAIAEKFEKAKSLEEAKKIFKSLNVDSKKEVNANEMLSSLNENTGVNIQAKEKHNVIFESPEVMRMRELANYNSSKKK